MVAQAFRSVDLPASELTVQPPNGRTLVNFKTNFYTEQGEFTRTVTLLGRQVELLVAAGAGAALSTAMICSVRGSGGRRGGSVLWFNRDAHRRG